MYVLILYVTFSMIGILQTDCLHMHTSTQSSIAICQGVTYTLSPVMPMDGVVRYSQTYPHLQLVNGT